MSPHAWMWMVDDAKIEQCNVHLKHIEQVKYAHTKNQKTKKLE